MKCILEFEPGALLTEGNGDPPRTCKVENAKAFVGVTVLNCGIVYVLTYRVLLNIEIISNA